MEVVPITLDLGAYTRRCTPPGVIEEWILFIPSMTSMRTRPERMTTD
jgi:hypothetical protein